MKAAHWDHVVNIKQYAMRAADVTDLVQMAVIIMLFALVFVRHSGMVYRYGRA